MINWNLLCHAQNYYSKMDFQPIETPWIVPIEINNITRPPQNPPILINNSASLVASGEQGFLHLLNRGFLPSGKWQTITPCFRTDSESPIHLKQFAKLELIDTQNITTSNLHNIIEIALQFFSQFFPNNNLHIIETPEGWDINFLDTELGSYAIKSHKHLNWICATGIAEPRFSNTLKTI